MTTASKLERAHMGRCKRGPCVPCLVGVSVGLVDPADACRGGESDDGHDLPMMEFNHCKRGNMRRGHLEGFATCLWHHHGSQQLYRLGLGKEEARARWGPNLFDNAKEFHATFGSDDDLIAVQDWWLQTGGQGPAPDLAL